MHTSIHNKGSEAGISRAFMNESEQNIEEREINRDIVRQAAVLCCVAVQSASHLLPVGSAPRARSSVVCHKMSSDRHCLPSSLQGRSL